MNKKPSKILIIDDDIDQAHLMELILERANEDFSVEVANSYSKGRLLLKSIHFDALVLDYHLPDKDGLQMLREFKESGITLPVVMVTGQGDERVAVEAMRLGAMDYIVKTKQDLNILPRVVQRVIKEHNLSAQLKLSEQRYFALFDKANIAIFILSAQDYTLLNVNKQSLDLTGYKKEEILNRSFSLLCSKSSTEEIRKFFDNLIQSGQSSSDQISLVKSDRRLVPCDISGSVVAIGENRVIQLFARDISEKVKMQRQLYLSRQRLISLFDGITDLISVQDHHHHLIMGNKKYAQIASQHTSRVVGEFCYKALFGRSEPCENCPAAETLKRGKAEFVEIFHKGRTFHIWTYPMAGLDDKPEFLVEYARDVTEQKEIEKQLIKSEKLAAVGLLSSGIAHELRNPLNIIETARYSIEELLGHKDQALDHKLGLINKSVRRASIIIDNLLQFSKHSEYEKERIDVEKLLDSTLSLVEKDVGLRNIKINRQYSGVPKVFFSLDSLKQVFLNIIINAVEAMPDGGNFKIVTRHLEEETAIYIDFIDNGVGISKEDIKHIFTPFFSTKSQKGGTGLGLYLSYTTVKKEGGDLFVKSRKGDGTSFTVKVPVVVESA
ncbi:response regulator [candidate division KSB1 bacterium]|nr:response regulator [candidate division KSB1 bacterium]